MKRLVVILLVLLWAAPALAVQPDEVMKDPALEARARAMSEQLRCLVCQNQSIDDSEAPLARDLRLLIREHLAKGESDQQIMDYIVARYGDYVLLRPRFDAGTAVLWLSPFAVLLLGILKLARRKPVSGDPEKPLSDEEKAAVLRALE